MSFIFYVLILLASAANQPIPLPEEVFTVLREQYPTSTFKMEPELEDLTVLIEGAGRKQSIKVGVTQQVLDLATYVDNKWKSFDLIFKAPFPIAGETQLFFINRYKPAGADAVKGLPCGKALKIRTQLDKLFTTQGVKLMTKDRHYLNLIGGDFLLTQLDGQRFRIVYFKVVDSRAANRLCNPQYN